jgi:hypothetical protein
MFLRLSSFSVQSEKNHYSNKCRYYHCLSRVTTTVRDDNFTVLAFLKKKKNIYIYIYNSLFFKIFSFCKYIKIIFYFLNFIFNISTSK